MRQRVRLQRIIPEGNGCIQPLIGIGLAWFTVPKQVPRKSTYTCSLARSLDRDHLHAAANATFMVVAF